MKLRAVTFGIIAVALAMIFTLMVHSGNVIAADGECTAYINGTDVSSYDTPDNALDVDIDDDITVSVVASASFASHKIDMAFTDFFSWTVSDETDDGTETSYMTTVDVADYASLGAGLYKVTATGVLVNGDECSTTAFINITGKNTLTTLIGIISFILAVFGVIGLILYTLLILLGIIGSPSMFSFLLGTIPLAAVLTTVGMVTGGATSPSPEASQTTGSGDTSQTPSTGRSKSGEGIRFRPKISILAIVCALLSAIGFVLLFQQMGVAYPTITVVVISLVLGLVAGILLPTLAMTFSRKRK